MGIPGALLFAALVAADPPEANPAPDLEPGKTYRGMSASGRPYLFRLPAKIERPNLLLLLHGTGLTYQWGFANYPELRPGDIVVSPESEQPGRGFLQAKPDREEVAGLIELFRKTYPVENVYLYGHSQGAFFCYYFAGEEPDLVDGIVAHAGNYLGFKTPKKAKENVAVGILHARADPVVTVACAFRTDLVYRSEGYENVRLHVVEGLPEHAGHWPLPWAVDEMLAWSDLVCSRRPETPVALALREAAKEKGDFAALANAVRRARELGAEGEQAAALFSLVDRARAAHATALGGHAQIGERKAEYGPWAAHARLAWEAFGPGEWAGKTLEKRVARDSKLVARAFDQLAKGTGRAFASGLQAMEDGFLGEDYDRLVLHLGWLREKPPRELDERERARFAELSERQRAADRDGTRAFAAAHEDLLAEFRRERADWLAQYR